MLHQHRAKRSGDRRFVQEVELPQCIFKRGNSYAVRYTVPRELYEISGKKEVVRTLGTGELRKAIATRDEVIEAIKRELREPKLANNRGMIVAAIDGRMVYLYRDERSRARYVFECLMGLTWPCTKGFLEKRELYQRFDQGWTSGELAFLSSVPFGDVELYREAMLGVPADSEGTPAVASSDQPQ
jgi:hypothetical protein